ncbi:MAG: NfeD family protein [Bacilli bacterium]|jgi:membrane protein implicated in regulation of membrane protease activity|nr:NfeD family protein [Acholeplasmataceae bacterium]
MPVDQILMLVFWTLVIIATFIVEIETAGLVSIWFTAGAIASLIAAGFGASIGVQILIFIVVSALLILLTRPLSKRFMNTSFIKTNADRYVGMIGEVTKEIPNDGTRGEVKVDHVYWSAYTTGKTTLPIGTKVIVQDIVGNRLLVAKIEEKEL